MSRLITTSPKCTAGAGKVPDCTSPKKTTSRVPQVSNMNTEIANNTFAVRLPSPIIAVESTRAHPDDSVWIVTSAGWKLAIQRCVVYTRCNGIRIDCNYKYQKGKVEGKGLEHG